MFGAEDGQVVVIRRFVNAEVASLRINKVDAGTVDDSIFVSKYLKGKNDV